MDYTFGYVGITRGVVDWKGNCGNISSAVGPYAIETGLVEPQDGKTVVRVRNLNTQRLIECHVPTPGRQVSYEGNTSISGVPGRAAGIQLSFLDIMGSKTGALLPTGKARDSIEGVDVTCLDAATPIIMLDAADLGLRGDESPAELDDNGALLERLESIRRKAGQRMGLGDVSHSVLPKPVLVCAARDGASTLCARYFVPHRCHRAIAVTGAIAVASAVSVPGTIAHRLAVESGRMAEGECLARVRLEHPSGFIDLDVEHRQGNPCDIARVSLIRTARKIMSGTIFYTASTPPGETMPALQAN